MESNAVERLTLHVNDDTLRRTRTSKKKAVLLMGQLQHSPFLRSVKRTAEAFDITCADSMCDISHDNFDAIVCDRETFKGDVLIEMKQDVDPYWNPCVTEAIALLLLYYDIGQDDHVVILGKGRSVAPLGEFLSLQGATYKYLDTRIDNVEEQTRGASAVVVAAPLPRDEKISKWVRDVTIDITDSITPEQVSGGLMCPMVQHVGKLTTAILVNRIMSL